MAPSPGKGPSQVKALVASAGASLSGALSKVVGSSKKCKAAGEAPGHLQSRDGRRALLDCLEALFVGRGVAKAEIGDLLLELGRDFNEDRLGREPGDDGAAAAEEARRTKSKNEMNLPPELVAFSRQASTTSCASSTRGRAWRRSSTARGTRRDGRARRGPTTTATPTATGRSRRRRRSSRPCRRAPRRRGAAGRGRSAARG